jgi:RNA polymerase sigma-70 factor (ECF subfamily)
VIPDDLQSARLSEIGGKQQSPGSGPESQDVDLVRQLQAGNPDALTSLFTKYSGVIFSFAKRMLRDPGEAEEVVQQVFLDVYKAIHRFDPVKGSFKVWLFQYSYHRALNRKKHLRAKGFYSKQELRESDLQGEEYEDAGRKIRFCSQEMVLLVQQLLNKIQPRQRVAVEMTFFEGLTAEEIARRTGETPSIVRHNLYRGMSKLRAAALEAAEGQKVSESSRIEGLVLGDPARTL